MSIPESTEVEPAVAVELFGDRIDLARLFTDALATHGEEYGLIGPLELPRLWPDVHFTLIEPMERRVKWLNDQVQQLGLDNVVVLRDRAEDVRLPEGFDQLTARAVSAFSKLIPMCAPLVVPGGEFILMKGINAAKEVDAAEKQIRRFKLRDVEVIELGEGTLPETTRVIRAIVS